ncbi:unnamed protein product [Acanthoscelides obtectus]|uniref:UBC core domain-containing protein n=1 Tax=Acanthoscelides obtectus TaxID=200917 RepID=A0A9P0PA72_ACAOB|nr:unnamed protein product [Acanthoscelides obtectus]CAK1644793.1 (E3-independent) E2 ubiquitin-conjugating enzyme UBE2O [Acanthoscelides obtectus]
MNNSEKVKEFYSNDVVYRFNKHKRMVFGVVVDSYEASSDVDENNALQKGQIRVMWNNSSREQVWRQQKVRLMNRSIVPGDIVRRLEKGKETQRGYCKEVKQIATVQIVGTDKIIEHVSSERLQSVRPFEIDDAVCLGNKFGRIEICVPANFEQPHWIKKSKTMKRNIHTRQRFTVQSVEDVLLEVSWYSNSSVAYSEISQDDIKKLKVLEHPSDSCLELAERKLLKLSASDVLLKKKDWIKKLSISYRPEATKNRHVVSCGSKIMPRVPKIRSSSFVYPIESARDSNTVEDDEEWWTEEGEESDDNGSSSSRNTSVSKSRKRHYPPRPRELVPGHTLPVEIICVESKITVVWQDGTEEKDIPSIQLYYSISLDDHEFFPGEWVDYDDFKGDKTVHGVIQSVNYLERTACVKWFAYEENQKKPTKSVIKEHSVYELRKHSKFVFRPGSIVKAKPAQDEKMGKVIDSCVEGYVKVQWLNGTLENCWPTDIELIPDSADYDASDDDSSEDEAAAVSWETESIESYAGDLSDETVLQNMAARLDFVRNKIIYLKEAFKRHTITENLTYLKELLVVYENSSYLDKLLGTSFFSLKSKHFQALLTQAKEKAKLLGVELRGRLFSSDNLCPMVPKIKVAEKENIAKMIRLENKINAQIEKKGSGEESTTPTTPLTPEAAEVNYDVQDNLCLELLSMLKVRMDLAYAEIISRIGGSQAFSVLTKASENDEVPLTSTPLPSCPTTPEDSFSTFNPPKLTFDQAGANEAYTIIEEAPLSHHYYTSKFEPTDLQKFLKTVQKEYKLLKESLPPGVWVRSYGNRIDLLSVMIRGPAKTPYEDGLFLFDIQLSPDYPRCPPVVHYISYSTQRLNPNLYVEGKVCVSLLGTWMGRGTEVWGPDSTLLQLIVSIQGLILVSEPYYNEAGYEKQTDTQQGYENSRTYNELVILKLVQSMSELLQNPPDVFKQEIFAHFTQNGEKLCEKLDMYCREGEPWLPEFPLLPVSKGLRLSLATALKSFQEVLHKICDKGNVAKET